MTEDNPEITATIRGTAYARPQILDRERQRAVKVLAKLGVGTVSGPLPVLRDALVTRKAELGHEALRALLEREVSITTQVARFGALASRGRRARTSIELAVSRGSAGHFVDWFKERTDANDEPAMLRAHPDHYVNQVDSSGRREVIETNGGSPMATRFFMHYDGLEPLVTPPDPEYPHQIASVARLADGRAIGGVRHQFRDEGDGFRAKLTVEFPRLSPPTLVIGHPWHLAIEFSNWIEAAARQDKSA